MRCKISQEFIINMIIEKFNEIKLLFADMYSEIVNETGAWINHVHIYAVINMIIQLSCRCFNKTT